MEYFDIVDENGTPTGLTAERSKAHAEGLPHRTAHLWLVRRREGRVQVLLQKRSSCKDSFPSCYDISSAGHIPAGEDYVPSALRELREELGLTAEAHELIPCGHVVRSRDEVFHGRPFRDREYSRVFLLVRGEDDEPYRLQKEEVESVLWMDMDECIAGVTTGAFPHCMYTDELEMVRDTFLSL